MTARQLAVGYVLGEENPAGHVELDWIGSVYASRAAAETALVEAYALGASHLNIYELHSLKPFEFSTPSS
ncbi:hypothetical protein [Rhodococcus sp. I2R]|uniref:hypothetical protein n=1 Tax=Rhodococcus sp. I2R TaxID=2855445 RepID=UPI001E517608|nr:hypothetical protein [Rhodococcus sp. I2R]MCC8930814.1 hypothetical protein [Rhodococcus sp. I2R]